MLERPISKAGWARVRFDQIATQVNDRVDNPAEAGVERYVGLEHLDPDSLRIRRWGEPTDVESTKLRFQQGDIIFGKRRVYQRKVAVADFEGICSAHAMVLRAKAGAVLPDFLPFFMQSDLFMERALSISVGSLSPTINWKALAAEEFLLPPIQEQARLLEVLLAASELRDGLGSVADTAATAMRSLCKRVFIEPRKKIATTRIGQIATVRNGTTPSRKNPDFWNGTVPWLPTGKVNERYIEAADECVTALALRKCSLRLIPAGSTLVAMIGEGTTRGKAALLRIDSTINQNFASVSPGDGVIPEFLFYQLESCYESLRHWSHGTNQHALNTKLVSDFPIWAPSIGEQKEIVAEIADLERQRVAAENRRDVFQDACRMISDKVLEGCGV
jgi:type I restriction enzyme S subunit